MEQIASLETLAEGAVIEQFGIEWQKCLQNITDPNTDARKPRKITVTVTLRPNEERDFAIVEVDVKSALAQSKGISTSVLIGGHGSLVMATERVAKQEMLPIQLKEYDNA